MPEPTRTNAAASPRTDECRGSQDGESDEVNDDLRVSLKRPLLLSAAAHVLALAACLVFGGDRGTGLRPVPVVEVLLAAGDDGAGGFGPRAPRRGVALRRSLAGDGAVPSPAPARSEDAPLTGTGGPAALPVRLELPPVPAAGALAASAAARPAAPRRSSQASASAASRHTSGVANSVSCP